MRESSAALYRKETPRLESGEKEKKGRYIDVPAWEVSKVKDVPPDLRAEKVMYDKLIAIMLDFGYDLLKKIANEPPLWGATDIVRNHRESELLAMIEGTTKEQWEKDHGEKKFKVIVEQLYHLLWRYRNFLKNKKRDKRKSLRLVG